MGLKSIVPLVRILIPPPERPATRFLWAISAAEKPSIGGLFSFWLRTAKSGEGPIFPRMGGFSPNLWTAEIQYGLESYLISGGCEGAGDVHFEIDVG